mgnify:CR=1 FL=1
MKKLRHNKKRNTAFLYEALIREVTKCILSKDALKKAKIVSIVREHFARGTSLRKELEIFKAVYETDQGEKEFVKSVISEAKMRYETDINKEKVFEEQTALIKKINKSIGSSVFSNFVPNYKSLATICQIFNNINIREKVLLENRLADLMSSKDGNKNLKPIDKLVYKTFASKFNEEYSDKLLKEQRGLLNEYIYSFSDGGLAFKVYLNEEIGRLREVVNDSLILEEVAEDEEMVQKTKEVLEIIESFKKEKINTGMIEKVMKIQKLASEIQTDGN